MTTIFVALIGLAGVLGSALITAWTQVYLRRNLGKSNGNGTVAEMVERCLELQVEDAEQDRALFEHLFRETGIPRPVARKQASLR